MRAIAVFNRDGGTFRTTDMDVYTRHAARVFADYGHSLDCQVVGGDQLEGALRRALARDDADALLVGGGDGTISAAAGLAWKAGVPLGIVPAGTMNLFARALDLPLDIWKAPQALATGQVMEVDIGSANGRPFVHQFSAGLHARMVRLRNAMSYSSRLGKIIASLRASVSVALDPPVFEVAFQVDDHREEMSVSAITVSNNPFGESPFLIAQSTDAGHLGVYVTDPLGRLGAIRLAADVLAWRLKYSPLIREMRAKEVNLSFPRHRRSARCVIDGELLPLARDIALRIHAGELKVLGGKPG